MIKKAGSELQSRFKQLSETGMGFQVVEATYLNNDIKEILVLNGTLLVEELRDVIQLSETGFTRLSASSQVESNIKSIELKRRSNIIKFSETIRANRSMGAIDSIVENTTNGERFIRFSAFGYDDFRLDRLTMSLLPNTYAAPYDDAIYCINASLNINDRYALPNDLLIKYIINIRPLTGTAIKRGIVQPANGWQGGGKEVIFTEGTDDNTVTSVENI